MRRKPLQQRRRFWPLAVVLGVAFGIIAWRIYAESVLKSKTEEQAVQVVNVIHASSGPAEEEIVLPGNVTAWHGAPIYARTNGYIKAWYTGMGTRVKKGDLMAEIDTPEIDAQLRQAEADLLTAQANNQLAQVTAERWENLLTTDSVSKQEADEKTGDARAKAAMLASAQANVDHLHDLESFKRVSAPFDGIVTSRTTDVGQLINSGSTTGQILFHVSQTDKLRVYVQVPENYSASITPDLTAEIFFTDHPRRGYKAKLYHAADAIEPSVRTQLIEFVLDNPGNKLLSGGYAEVHMKVPSPPTHVRLPANTLIFRSEGLQVATLDANNHALLKTVMMGRDFGNTVEIVSGIDPQEIVIVNPPDSLISGEQVRVAQPVKKEEGKKDADKHEEKKP